MRWYKTQRQPQKGAVLICVIICLAVATLLLAGMLKGTLLTMRQIRTERHLRQTEWLVQAGAERAAFRLASDVEYTGEVWSLAAQEIAGTDPGVVSISVSRDSTDRARVRVVAEFPSGSVASIRRTREFLIDLPQD
jgi:nanoRNase/pAp phosphatase (c-di-AMP/oligoRNAs hydrolase)